MKKDKKKTMDQIKQVNADLQESVEINRQMIKQGETLQAELQTILKDMGRIADEIGNASRRTQASGPSHYRMLSQD
jgi:predicted phage gp36 major capsid-like protein